MTYATVSNMEDLQAQIELRWGKPMTTAVQALHHLALVSGETYQKLLVTSPQKIRVYIDAMAQDSNVSEIEIEHLKSEMMNTPEVDVVAFNIEPLALTRFSWAQAEKFGVVPLGFLNDVLYLASWQPMNHELLQRVGMVAGCSTMLLWAAKDKISARIAIEARQVNSAAQDLNFKAKPSNIENQEIKALVAMAEDEVQVIGDVAASTITDERSGLVWLVRRMIIDAYRKRSSDIHIETNAGSEDSIIRFRVDGDLEDYLRVPHQLRAALVSRIKIMSQLDISERRRPQDGKASFRYSDIALDLRVAIIPTHDGLEDAVLRLLVMAKPLALSQLGFSARDEKLVKKMTPKSYGLILACGPTGSGKTTTLHSLLSEINIRERKVWTAEDPIEITQPGLRQVQVNPKIGLTFASAMRAFLRADPDVIMIGEVRDQETAQVCVEASLTGHLVFSTLHTNNAAESIVRLLDLGLDPMNFGDSLVGIIAQRLVRKLCKHCKRAELLAEADFEALMADYIEGTAVDAMTARERLRVAASMAPTTIGPIHTYFPVGCARCDNKGYKGRVGVYEVLQNTREQKQLIHTRASTDAIFAQAIADGTSSLRQDALAKVLAGAIDLKQAMTIAN